VAKKQGFVDDSFWVAGGKKSKVLADIKISFSCSFCSCDRPSILGILISVTTRSIWPFAFSAARASTLSRPPLKAL
jgi:hypothetical protein